LTPGGPARTFRSVPSGLAPAASRTVTIAGTRYPIEVLARSRAPEPDAVAIVVPCHEAFELTRLCLDAIRRFTDVPHEVWVVDNASSPATVGRLVGETDANLILNRAAPWRRSGLFARFLPWYRQAGGGSVANGVALELAAEVVQPRWMFCMHNDAMPARRGWLAYLRSRLDARTRAVGVRQDPTRVRAAHQSGLLFDFSLFRPLRMSFMPGLPAYDVGDLVSVRLREAGYEVAICDNAYNRPELRERLPEGHWLKAINCDIAFDAAGEIVYLHLGRGTLRYSQPGSEHARQLALDDWLALVRAHILAP
jgi:hypothetical protein